jgi:hypothetical protein
MDWLNETPFLGFDDLASRLGVSSMTIHRDVDALVQAGQAAKVHGGVTLPVKTTSTSSTPRCALCREAVPARSDVVIHLDTGKVLEACCPHCGLILLGMTEGVVSALAKDFLYGQMVECRHAAYVVGSEVALCCRPSVLCFATLREAQQFQSGFGGQVMDFSEVQRGLNHTHAG